MKADAGPGRDAVCRGFIGVSDSGFRIS